MKPEIKYLRGDPLNRLHFAINHYISTGDHVGEGVGTRADGVATVFIPVDLGNPTDVADFECLKSKLASLRGEGMLIDLAKIGVQGKFTFWSMTLGDDMVPLLAAKLMESPGPLGWGSMKESVIDQHEWVEAP